MRLSRAERLWVRALLEKGRGRLRAALAACRRACRLQEPSPPQLALLADVEAGLGLPFAAARHTPPSPLAAERLWRALLPRAAEAQGHPPVARLCRAFRRARAAFARRGALPEPRVVDAPELDAAAAVGALAGDRAFRLEPRFRGLRAHPAVRLYREAARRGMTAIGLQRAVLSGAAFPLRSALADFAREARFAAYRRSLRLPDLRAEIRRRGYARLFVDYAGLAPAARYELALAPLHAPGGAARLNAIALPGDDGVRRIVSTLPPPFDYAAAAWNVWHELGHALADHWIEDHAAALERSRPALAAACARRYGTWEQAVREYFAQGLATRMLAWSGAGGRPDGGARDPSLPDLPRVVAEFAAYEAERRRTPDLEAFYPRLLELLARLARGRRGAPEGRALRAQSDRP